MICATLANLHRAPGSPGIDPRSFHPMERDQAQGAGMDVDADSVGMIGEMFEGMKEGY